MTLNLSGNNMQTITKNLMDPKKLKVVSTKELNA